MEDIQRRLPDREDYAKSIVPLINDKGLKPFDITGLDASGLRIFQHSAYPRLCGAPHKRGFCPSCMGRRMSGASGPLGERKAWPWATTAANLIERVLPPSTGLWPKARLRAGSGC